MNNVILAKYANLGYPLNEWVKQSRNYDDYKFAYDGDFLNELLSPNSDELKYPLGINPFKLPVSLHTSFLFGEVPDRAIAQVTPEVEIWNNGKRATSGQAEADAQRAAAFLNEVIEQNSGRSMLSRVALDMQVYGGAVIGAYINHDMADLPICVQAVDVRRFYPAWSDFNPEQLLAAIIAYDVSAVSANSLGINIGSSQAAYTEHWTAQDYQIEIDNQSVQSGPTPGSVIPYTYIPHPPRGTFYGTSLLHGLLELAREINFQEANVGDIISSEANAVPAVRNVRNPELIRVGGRKVLLDLGYQSGDRVPDILYPTSKASSAVSYTAQADRLSEQLNILMYCSKVLFGGGDSSQRSTSSFAFMAIPLIAHIREERANISTAYARVCRNVLKLAAILGIGGIKPQLAERVRVRCNWYPMLPRDAIEESTIIINRYSAGLLSLETAIEKIGDILDVAREVDRIKEAGKPSNNQNQSGALGELAGIQAAKGQPDNSEQEESNNGERTS